MTCVYKEAFLVCDVDGQVELTTFDRNEAELLCDDMNADHESILAANSELGEEDKIDTNGGPFTVERFVSECDVTSDRHGISTPCPRCKGLGRRMYSNGATWRGGVGTCSSEPDVCDSCWGSGDSERTFEDRRKVEAGYERRIKEATLERWLGERGAPKAFGRPNATQQWLLSELIAFLDSLERRRNNPPPYGSWSIIDAMRFAITSLLDSTRSPEPVCCCGQPMSEHDSSSNHTAVEMKDDNE